MNHQKLQLCVSLIVFVLLFNLMTLAQITIQTDFRTPEVSTTIWGDYDPTKIDQVFAYRKGQSSPLAVTLDPANKTFFVKVDGLENDIDKNKFTIIAYLKGDDTPKAFAFKVMRGTITPQPQPTQSGGTGGSQGGKSGQDGSSSQGGSQVGANPPTDGDGERFRLLLGFEQAGANAATSQVKPFVDLMASFPIRKGACVLGQEVITTPGQAGGKGITAQPGCQDGKKYYPVAFWTNLRVSSTPEQSTANLQTLNTISTGDSVLTAAGGTFSKVNTLIQSFQMRAGLELTHKNLQWGSCNNNWGGCKFQSSFIFGAGITSALSTSETVSQSIFKVPLATDGKTVLPAFKELFGKDDKGNDVDFANIKNVLLTYGERDRFKRNWFAGIRAKYFYSTIASDYPASFDLTIGQDEVMTNKLVGAVLRFDGFMPIPFKPLDAIYFGFNVNTKLTKKVNTTIVPFFLEPTANYNLYDGSTLIRNLGATPFANSNRDNFSFRFGIDLLKILRTYQKAAAVANNANTNANPNANPK